MVMACVALRPRKAAALTRAGVTDSKRFAGRQRARRSAQRLVPKHPRGADHVAVMVVDVAEIDRRCRDNGLNRLEQERAALPDPARARLPPHRLRRRAPVPPAAGALAAPRGARPTASCKHAAVAAASIVAKVRRDELWAKICRRYAPEFGDDWSAPAAATRNAPTRAFLRAYIARYRRLPPEARRSWPWEFARDLLGAALRSLVGRAGRSPAAGARIVRAHRRRRGHYRRCWFAGCTF